MKKKKVAKRVKPKVKKPDGIFNNGEGVAAHWHYNERVAGIWCSKCY